MEVNIQEKEISYSEDAHEIHLKRYLEETQPRKVLGTRFKVVLLCLFLGLLAVLPFHTMGRRDSQSQFWQLSMPITHDMHLHLQQMQSFYNGLSAGKIFPRWEEDTNFGFGAITTSYYPPAIYYLTSLFYFLSRDWMVTIFITHLFLMLAAGAAIYVYTRQFLSIRAAAVAMGAYMLLPYHLVDQYQRGALAELMSFIWMPLLLLFCDKIFRRDENDVEAGNPKKLLLNIAGLSACYGAFLWSHPPTAYQFSLVFGMYILWQTLSKKNYRGLAYVGGSILFGVLLSAAYLLPAYLERHLVRTEYIAETWPYHATYIFYHKMPFYDGNRGFFYLLDAVWIFSALVLVVCGLFFWFQRQNLNATLKQRVWVWLGMGGFVSLMMLRVSEPLGRLIPKIDIGVFTWRMLGISTLVCALLAGVCANLAFESETRSSFLRSASSIITGFIVIGGILLTFFTVIKPMVYAPIFVPDSVHINFATIPVGAPENPLDNLPQIEKTMLASTQQGVDNGTVTIEQWLPELRVLHVKVNRPDKLLIRTFNSPGWVAKFNERETPILTGKMFGEINLLLPAGEYQLKLEYTDTAVRRNAELLTLVSFLGLLILVAAPFGFRRFRPAKVNDEMNS